MVRLLAAGSSLVQGNMDYDLQASIVNHSQLIVTAPLAFCFLADYLRDILRARLNHHSSTAIQELTHTIGVLASADIRTTSVQKAVSDLIKAMPSHRVIAAELDVLGRASILNGIICRIQGYGDDQRLRGLSGCTIYLRH